MNMKQTTTIFRVIAAVIIISVVAILANHFAGKLADRAEGYVEDKKVELSLDVPEVEDPTAGFEEATGEVTKEAMQPAKRIVQVPDTQNGEGSDEIDWADVTVTFDNLVNVSEAVFDAALDGDIDAAFRLRDLRRYCRLIPRDEVASEKWVEDARKMVVDMEASGQPVPQEGQDSIIPGMIFYPDEQRNRAELLKATKGCSDYRDTFSAALREQLAELAKQGHVMARYIYATWELEPVVDVVAFERHQEWQLNAVDFSYANLEEGEPVGILAFGRSYYLGLFTRNIPPLGVSLLKAAADCGIESAHLEGLLAGFEKSSSLSVFQWVFPASNEDILALAEHMVSYCQ